MFEKMHITVSYLSVFGKYVEPLKKNRISVVKSTEKCWMDATMSILLWFLWTSNFNIFLLEATRLTINSPHSLKRKKIAKLNDCQNTNAIKVLGYSNIEVYEVQVEYLF